MSWNEGDNAWAEGFRERTLAGNTADKVRDAYAVYIHYESTVCS